MWLFTKYGFFSIVRMEDKTPNQKHDELRYFVRARAREDLESLVLHGRDFIKNREIMVSDVTDYRYRIIVDAGELLSIMALIGSNIDYTNFKQAISEHPIQNHKAGILGQIWGIMFDYQQERNCNSL